MFHKHKWKEIVRTYKPSPLESAKEFKNAYEWCFQSKTTILWECEICQKLRKEEIDGKIIS